MARSQFGRFIAAGTLSGMVLVAPLANAQETPKFIAPKPGFFCNLNAMTPKERARHEKLGKKLWQSGVEVKELEDGYAFRLEQGKISLVEVAEWISGENKCCSFFHFEVELQPKPSQLWLKIRGEEGIKQFIRATFGV
jgi:hypothetical protein